MSGTRMSRTFDGRWVNTIVLMSPNLRRDPRGGERRDAPPAGSPRRRSRRATAGSTPNCRLEPVGHQALRDEPAGEGIEREQDREPEHDALRTMQPESPPDAVVLGARWEALRRPVRRRQNPATIDDPDERVADDDRAISVERRRAPVQQRLADEPRRERAGRRRDVPDEVVPGERRRPACVGHRLRQRRLLDGEERSDLVAGRRDDADRASQDEQRHPAGRARRRRPR